MKLIYFHKALPHTLWTGKETATKKAITKVCKPKNTYLAQTIGKFFLHRQSANSISTCGFTHVSWLYFIASLVAVSFLCPCLVQQSLVKNNTGQMTLASSICTSANRSVTGHVKFDEVYNLNGYLSFSQLLQD